MCSRGSSTRVAVPALTTGRTPSPTAVRRFKPEDESKHGMITIAGAKGGCGKTTATLGLAKALAEAGTPTIAVDADRQLPDLHTTAEVEREPTIAALDGETDVTSVAKQVPGAPGVGVIPAQTGGENVDLGATLKQLDYDTVEVLVDSPSGAGPDVVEPIAAADQVVVVTTGTERSVESARTTIDVARRIDVPVAGVLVTRCETVPDRLADELDADVLGAVPEREPPLSDGDVHAAFVDVAEALTDESGRLPGQTDPATRRPDRVSTGIDGLDDLLDGGVPAGSIVALEADAASQAELLLHDLTGTRGTLYLTTERSEPALRDALENSPVAVGNPTIRYLGSEDPIGGATELLADLPDSANLIVDPAGPLESAERAAYVDFLNALKERLVEADGLGLLYCLADRDTPHRSVTEHVADAVVRFETTPDGDGDGSRHEVEVCKFRSESHPGDRAPVDFSEAVPLETPTR